MSRESIVFFSVVATLFVIWLHGRLDDRRFRKNLKKFNDLVKNPTDSLSDLLWMARFSKTTAAGQLWPWFDFPEVIFTKDDCGILAMTPVNGTEPIILRGAKWGSAKNDIHCLEGLPGVNELLRVRISLLGDDFLQVYKGSSKETWELLGVLDLAHVTRAEVF